MLINTESGLLGRNKKIQDQGTFALGVLVSWHLLSLRLRQQLVSCLFKVRRRFLITKQHSLVVGTQGWDAGKTNTLPIQTDSFDSEKLILLLFPIFTLCPPHALRHLEEGPSYTCNHWIRRTEQFWGRVYLLVCFGFVFFSEVSQGSCPLNNPYLWGAREAQGTRAAGEIIEH